VTHTLHRDGDAASFGDDYILLAMVAKGHNDEGAVEKLRTFLRICAAHKPVNMGNGDLGAYYPSEISGTAAEGKRDPMPDYEKVIAGVGKPNSVAAEFDSKEKLVAALRDVIKADLGISINLSHSVEGAHQCCRETGIQRHSVEYALGFMDRHNHLPNSQVVELSTMCGHGMVSHNLVEKMIASVKENDRTPEEAARYLACFCPCGVYNPARAKRLLEEARTRQH
jgi:hypothetical protein